MKILFIHQHLGSFVQKDLDILRSLHIVRSIQFSGRKGLIRNFLPDLLQLWQDILWCDLAFSWFGKIHAFFAVLFCKLLGKKTIVVSGGDEVENCFIGGKRWGWCSHPMMRFFSFVTFHYADLVIAHSKYNLHSTIANAKSCPERTLLIYHGFDANFFHFNNKGQRENLVVTVGTIDNESLYRKGHKLFVESARYLPKLQFDLVGPIGEKSTYQFLVNLASDNVCFEGGLYGTDLVDKFGQAKVYIQVSECESFACSMAEAMLCECIPVVSKAGAIPEVVGDCGFYIDKFEPKEVAKKIKEALKASPEIGKKARERIIKHFPLEKRKREILAAVSLLEKAE